MHLTLAAFLSRSIVSSIVVNFALQFDEFLSSAAFERRDGGWFRLKGRAVAAEVLRELSPITQRVVGCEQWLGGTNVFVIHPFPAEF